MRSFLKHGSSTILALLDQHSRSRDLAAATATSVLVEHAVHRVAHTQQETLSEALDRPCEVVLESAARPTSDSIAPCMMSQGADVGRSRWA